MAEAERVPKAAWTWVYRIAGALVAIGALMLAGRGCGGGERETHHIPGSAIKCKEYTSGGWGHSNRANIIRAGGCIRVHLSEEPFLIELPEGYDFRWKAEASDYTKLITADGTELEFRKHDPGPCYRRASGKNPCRYLRPPYRVKGIGYFIIYLKK